MARVIELITPAKDVLEPRVLEQLRTDGRSRVVFGRGQLTHGTTADVAVLEHWFADTDSMKRALAASWALPVAGQHWFERIVVSSEHEVWPRGAWWPTWSDGLVVALWLVGLCLAYAGIVVPFAGPAARIGLLEVLALTVAALVLLLDAGLRIRALWQQRWHLGPFLALPVLLCLYGVPVLLVVYGVWPEINVLPGQVCLVAGLGCMLLGNLAARINQTSSSSPPPAR